eukprot:TRINITY_DN1129_c0_g1_i2.p1 TRINITY_DN1129_c0_g1~~TRINITY_DN1129_c0_g1_i2.p1  ORF type:complete len:260 (+),score=61.56 TRINITY_DN1129_c0_g1_i2:155-934(+)
MSVPNLRSIGDYETAAQFFRRLETRCLYPLGLSLLPNRVKGGDVIDIVSEDLHASRTLLRSMLCAVVAPASHSGLESSALLLTTAVHFDGFGFTDTLASYIHMKQSEGATEAELQSHHQSAMHRLHVAPCCSELSLLASLQRARSLCLADASICVIAIDTINAWCPLDRQAIADNSLTRATMASLQALAQDFDLAVVMHSCKDTSHQTISKLLPATYTLRAQRSSANANQLKVEVVDSSTSPTTKQAIRLTMVDGGVEF